MGRPGRVKKQKQQKREAGKKMHAVERIELTKAQQHTVASLFIRREQILIELNRVLNEINEGLDDLAQTYAHRALLRGEWEFWQDEPGEQNLYLRRKQPKADAPPISPDPPVPPAATVEEAGAKDGKPTG